MAASVLQSGVIGWLGVMEVGRYRGVPEMVTALEKPLE
jgi:hypothetical protein